MPKRKPKPLPWWQQPGELAKQVRFCLGYPRLWRYSKEWEAAHKIDRAVPLYVSTVIRFRYMMHRASLLGEGSGMNGWPLDRHSRKQFYELTGTYPEMMGKE